MKSIAVMLVLFSLSHYCGAQQNATVDRLLRQLKAPDTAQSAEEQLRKLGSTNESVRETLSNALPGILHGKGALGALQYQAKLAGDLKIETTVPELIILLTQPNEVGELTSAYRFITLANDPVGKALSQMGDAAIPGLSGLLKTGDIHTRSRAIRVLLLINSTASQQALREHLSEESNPSLRSLIEKSLK